MSHVVTIDLKIKNIDALKAAATELGLEFVEGKTTYRWYGRWVNDYHGNDAAYRAGISPEQYGTCDHVIRIPGDERAYEIGVVRQADGSYAIVFDAWGPGRKLLNYIGDGGKRLKQLYAVHAARLAAQARGFNVQRIETREGITLILRR